MRYDLQEETLHGEMRTSDYLDVADLPDDLAELALQLGGDADRLTGLYPARLPAGDELPRPVAETQVAATRIPSRRRFGPGIWRVGTVSRVAAAVCIVGGVALAISGQSIWRGMFGAPLEDTSLPLWRPPPDP